jgi:hypothetical protein
MKLHQIGSMYGLKDSLQGWLFKPADAGGVTIKLLPLVSKEGKKYFGLFIEVSQYEETDDALSRRITITKGHKIVGKDMPWLDKVV